MEDEKPLSTLDADRVIWDAMGCADKVAEGEVDPEELLESISVPALPDGDPWEGYEGWIAGLVRAVIEAVARATDEGPKESCWRQPPEAPDSKWSGLSSKPRR